MPKSNQKTLVILDTHALIHRAFHALPPFSAPNGEPVGAVYGVANVLFKITKDFQPDYIAAAFDRPEPTFRHEAYGDYKGTRAEISPDIIPQFQRTKELLQAFGVATFEAAGYEADDILGTIVSHEHVKDKGLRIVIASGDLDAVQLVDGDQVVVYTLKKGIADTIVYNEAAVKERFGFPPRLLPDYKGLRGDTSDNIKGVPGIGEKTGCMLVATYGSLEEIYKHLDDIRGNKAFRGKVADLLAEHKKDAFFSRELATIRRDVPITFSLDDARWGIFNKTKAAQFLQELNFKSLVNRIPEPTGSAGVVADSPQESLFVKAEESADELISSGSIELMPETGLASLMKASELGWLPEGEDLLVTVGDNVWRINQEFLAAHEPEFSKLFQIPNIEHITSDAKKVLKMLWHAGSKAEPLFFDVSVAAWVLDPSLRDPLEVTAQTLLPTARDLAKRLTENKLDGVFRTIETPLIPMLARMEETGITVDASILNEFSKELAKTLKTREKKIYKLAGEEFNVNSPRQLSEILFTKLQIDTKGLRKTGTGVNSTRASELHKLKGVHPLIDEILRYREEAKLQSTYVTVLPKLIQTDGRIHTTYNQIGAVTGRLSSIDPNLQNIPIRTELGKGIRRAFVASKGYELLSFDYSQMELRLAASIANDQKMIAAFKSGQDIHAITASNVYHVPLEEVQPEMRRAAKTINFGVLYGMGPVSLAESLSISRKEASLFIAEYFKQFPKVKKYLEEMKQKALERGYVETLFGRRRYFPNMESLGWQARREAERMAINAPIQGSGADIIKMAIVKLGKELRVYFERDELRLLLQVHDELLFEVKPKLRQELAPRIQHIMEKVCELGVDLTVGVKHGSDWYSLV